MFVFIGHDVTIYDPSRCPFARDFTSQYLVPLPTSLPYEVAQYSKKSSLLNEHYWEEIYVSINFFEVHQESEKNEIMYYKIMYQRAFSYNLLMTA